jgi:hypothetical protein
VELFIELNVLLCDRTFGLLATGRPTEMWMQQAHLAHVLPERQVAEACFEGLRHRILFSV